MKNFCLGLREHATKITDYERKRNDIINKWRKENTSLAKRLLYMQERFRTNSSNKKYFKVRDHCHYTGKYRGAAHDIYNLTYKTPK